MHEILFEIMRGLLGLSGTIAIGVVIVLTLLVFLTPFFIYRIRNEIIDLNRNILAAIDILQDISECLGTKDEKIIDLVDKIS